MTIGVSDPFNRAQEVTIGVSDPFNRAQELCDDRGV